MKKLFLWLRESNRIKHLLGGFVIGLGANDLYCAAYAGGGVAAALELKDHLYGGKWDWIDIAITMEVSGLDILSGGQCYDQP